jgi:hypothetical protein
LSLRFSVVRIFRLFTLGRPAHAVRHDFEQLNHEQMDQLQVLPVDIMTHSLHADLNIIIHHANLTSNQIQNDPCSQIVNFSLPLKVFGVWRDNGSSYQLTYYQQLSQI